MEFVNRFKTEHIYSYILKSIFKINFISQTCQHFSSITNTILAAELSTAENRSPIEKRAERNIKVNFLRLN